MKSDPQIAMAVTALLFAAHAPLPASGTDKRIESSFRKSYVFQTSLKDDAITARSKGGNDILTGKVAKESRRVLAGESMAGLPGVKRVDNRLKVKGKRLIENSDGWVKLKVETALLLHPGANSGRTMPDFGIYTGCRAPGIVQDCQARLSRILQ
jgi:osmotically-inducible protein OsmY